MTKIAVMGYGVVGSGTVDVFVENRESIKRKSGIDFEVARILDLREFPDSPYADKFTKNFEDILNDSEISIVAEVMGGVTPAFEFTKRLLESGKSVVTSNKELVAKKGMELLQVAKEHGVNYMFEASVGGAIPVLRPLISCLAANEINEIIGILNGTTNFMLSKMIDDGMSYDEALKLAQQLGYAEKNPSADVDGHDTCRKICILSDLAYGKEVKPNEVYTEGISKVTLSDVANAEKLDSVIKLVGSVRKADDNGVYVYVAPVLINREYQLSNVNDVFNAVMVKGNMSGDVMFYGRGAGKLPTASAVAADIIDCAVHSGNPRNIYWSESEKGYVKPIETDRASFYVRAKLTGGETEALSELSAEKLAYSESKNEIAMVTDEMTVGEVFDKLKNSKALSDGVAFRILK